jgi:Tfp pilus assembly protein PilF
MERSLELEPNNGDALTNLAAMYADLGQHSRAKEIHLKILELEPHNADHLNNYAAFLQRIGTLRFLLLRLIWERQISNAYIRHNIHIV